MMEERFNQTLLNNKNHDENPYNKTIEEKVDELQATMAIASEQSKRRRKTKE